MTVMPTGMIVGANGAWAAMAKNVKPETFATMVQVARDIYPHDRVADKYYAMVVEGLDGGAGKSEDDKKLLEQGVAELNKAAGGSYTGTGWEKDRVALLEAIESSGRSFRRFAAVLSWVSTTTRKYGRSSDTKARAPRKAAISNAASMTSTGSTRSEGGQEHGRQIRTQ